MVGDGKVLVEKLGRNDPCPCGSGRRFQTLLHALGSVSTGCCATITTATDAAVTPSSPGNLPITSPPRSVELRRPGASSRSCRRMQACLGTALVNTLDLAKR
ncbi:MAG: SEC-C metal-binding domain-containing protein [Alphaproteobacteria bacterium]